MENGYVEKDALDATLCVIRPALREEAQTLYLSDTHTKLLVVMVWFDNGLNIIYADVKIIS